MYYAKGDSPAAPFPVLPTRDGDVVDLGLYASAQAQLVQPDGSTTPAAAVLLEDDDPDGPAVEVTVPTLEQAGLVGLRVQLLGDGILDTFDVEPIVVEDRDGWHTLASARSEWDGAKHIGDARLYVLLQAAREACVSYKPAAGLRRPTVTEREAQLVQARNRNAAAGIDPASGDDGVDGYGVSAFPMDWAVKALLRPPSRFGAIR